MKEGKEKRKVYVGCCHGHGWATRSLENNQEDFVGKSVRHPACGSREEKVISDDAGWMCIDCIMLAGAV